MNSPAAGIIIYVMGVSGCGKSTVAQQLAEHLQAHWRDGDELHPADNIRRMSAGIPLTDTERQPWLEAVRDYARRQSQQHAITVIACSALKRRYRQLLNEAGEVYYVYLEGSSELIGSRMHQRSGHFMPAELLASQLDALEDPRAEANVITVSVDATPEAISAAAAEALRSLPGLAVPHGD